MALVVPLFLVIVMDLMDWMHANNYASVVTLLSETQNVAAFICVFFSLKICLKKDYFSF